MARNLLALIVYSLQQILQIAIAISKFSMVHVAGPSFIFLKLKYIQTLGQFFSLLFVGHASNLCHTHSVACIFAFLSEIYKFEDSFLAFIGLIILLMDVRNIISFANISFLFNSMKYETVIFCSITTQDFQKIKVKVELFK